MADVTTPFGFPYPESTDLVRDGATDIEALAEGVNDQFLAGFQFAGQRIYTSSGQFVKADPLLTGDIGLRAIRVRMVGGGGGGSGARATGGSQVSGGGSGAGGGFCEKFITDIAGLATSETVVRGAGGTGGAATGSGGAGGASTFTTMTANGGQGGTNTTAGSVAFVFGVGGIGGSASGGDLNIRGGGGMAFDVRALDRVYRMGSGSSQLGGGVQEEIASVGGGNNGTAGQAFGGGGGNGANNPNQPGRTGGAGGNGIVIIDCFV